MSGVEIVQFLISLTSLLVTTSRYLDVALSTAVVSSSKFHTVVVACWQTSVAAPLHHDVAQSRIGSGWPGFL